MLRPFNSRSMARCRCAAAVGFLVVGSVLPGAAVAADWVERPFHPDVGSHWLIQSTETEKDEAGGVVTGTSTKKITAALSFEEKLPEGYQFTYRRTDSSYEGDADDPATARAALAAMQGHTFRAVTNNGGKPLRVENLPELRAAIRKMVDDVAATTASPQIAAAVKQILAEFAEIDDKRAAAKNLDDLPMVALGQNTGLKIGEVREEKITEPVPGASPLLKTVTLALVDAAPDGATAHYRMTETGDPESMRAMLLALLGRLDQSNPDVGRQIEAIQKMQFTQTQRTEIDVVDGMTRALDIVMVTEKSMAGAGAVMISNHRSVTIAPAP